MHSSPSLKSGIRTALIVIFSVILLDQSLKIWIKTHLTLDEEIHIFGDWFILHFTENPGMAFGMEFGGEYGKLMLTLFRIIAVGGLSYYLFSQIKHGARIGFIICLAMITAGAAGNIIDSIFYGVLFSESNHYELATLFPDGGGYASWFHGKVVDMLYMPIFKGYLPESLGGEYFIFFRPIFNIADASISLGVFFILLFQRRYFPSLKKNTKEEEENEVKETLDENSSEKQLIPDQE
ncbi:MAG: lipoprotein signal peptidase [Bacteroidetes bacterium]|nr:lipoprotein signal peptidase [Bacteroidota bacterium]